MLVLTRHYHRAMIHARPRTVVKPPKVVQIGVHVRICCQQHVQSAAAMYTHQTLPNVIFVGRSCVGKWETSVGVRKIEWRCRLNWQLVPDRRVVDRTAIELGLVFAPPAMPKPVVAS